MLKKDFFSAIENLLKAGFQPRFYTVNSGRIGLITFTDKNGTKQVPPGRKEKQLNLQSKCNKKRSTHQLEYNFVSTQKPFPNDTEFTTT
nr:hypothetical protein [Klebsiella pneumoniae subsp. pneumoniae]